MNELEDNEQILQRKEKLKALRNKGQAYPNDFERTDLAQELHEKFKEAEAEALAAQPVVSVAGRIMFRRLMGKASFVNLQDMSGRIQLYIAQDQLPEGAYAEFKLWDIGDIIGAEGFLFRTKSGELSIKVNQLKFLSKALRPLPDKFHGLTDQEQRFRQRYLDLIMNESTRKIFQIRSALISHLRKYFDSAGFIEVETPMMQVKPGGAAAKPFITHHNAMDMEMYLRIAPELYLKRLVVGGFEKVYEINRNFRNEGISTRHNPEFTMLEFYHAYLDYIALMNFTEKLFQYLAKNVLGALQFTYQGLAVDLSKPFERLTLKQAILQHAPEISIGTIGKFAKSQRISEKIRFGYS